MSAISRPGVYIRTRTHCGPGPVGIWSSPSMFRAAGGTAMNLGAILVEYLNVVSVVAATQFAPNLQRFAA